MKSKRDFVTELTDAWNSHDVEKIAALYSEDVVFKSPRVATLMGQANGTIQGKAAVREYWREILKRNPQLRFAIGHAFAGVDTFAVEYRVGNQLRGFEFMILNDRGLVQFAAGNDALPD